MYSSEDMITDRQKDRHTHQNTPFSCRGRSNVKQGSHRQQALPQSGDAPPAPRWIILSISCNVVFWSLVSGFEYMPFHIACSCPLCAIMPSSTKLKVPDILRASAIGNMHREISGDQQYDSWKCVCDRWTRWTERHAQRNISLPFWGRVISLDSYSVQGLMIFNCTLQQFWKLSKSAPDQKIHCHFLWIFRAL